MTFVTCIRRFNTFKMKTNKYWIISLTVYNGCLYPIETWFNSNVIIIKICFPLDNDWFINIAKAYAKENKHMSSGKQMCRDEKYPEGITNGAQWYFPRKTCVYLNLCFSTWVPPNIRRLG
jgi:hypothetical protein